MWAPLPGADRTGGAPCASAGTSTPLGAGDEVRATSKRAAGVVLAALTMVASLLLAPATATTTTFTAEADAFVLSSSPNANRGSATTLRIHDADKVSYFRFNVASLPTGEIVTSATLQVNASSPSRCALGAEVLRAANDAWGEATITWSNQPGATGPVIDSKTWTTNGYKSFDVTSAVTGAGPVSFVLSHATGCGATGDAAFQSRETTQKPRLVVETAPAPPAPACSDALDNDSDGLIDFPADPGCTDANDTDETDQSQERPNVLIIMTDDQRASSDGLSVMDDLRAIYGDGGTYYPNGVVTTPLCCPSRASTFSGRYAHNTGVVENNGNPLDQTTTLQYHLQNLGYKTALTGKYLNEFTGVPPYFDLLALRVSYGDPAGDYGTTYIRDRALEFLDAFEQNDPQPWLMYVTPHAPHEPSTPEATYRAAPVPAWEDNPARTETDLTDKPPSVLAQQASKTSIQSLRTNMIRTLYSVDDLIAAIFSRLDALGESNTLAFFLSDNGYQWYEHGLDKKGKPYNDSVRVPFFMRWPGHVPDGVVDSKIVANIDIAPTVYDAVGYAPANYTVDGRSIFSSQRSVILTEGKGRGFQSLWTPDWMYVEYDDGFLEYYGPGDPRQLDNGFITGNPPSNAAELHSQLESFRDCTGTLCP
jgi:sulfatase-like protein